MADLSRIVFDTPNAPDLDSTLALAMKAYESQTNAVDNLIKVPVNFAKTAQQNTNDNITAWINSRNKAELQNSDYMQAGIDKLVGDSIFGYDKKAVNTLIDNRPTILNQRTVDDNATLLDSIKTNKEYNDFLAIEYANATNYFNTLEGMADTPEKKAQVAQARTNYISGLGILGNPTAMNQVGDKLLTLDKNTGSLQNELLKIQTDRKTAILGQLAPLYKATASKMKTGDNLSDADKLSNSTTMGNFIVQANKSYGINLTEGDIQALSDMVRKSESEIVTKEVGIKKIIHDMSSDDRKIDETIRSNKANEGLKSDSNGIDAWKAVNGGKGNSGNGNGGGNGNGTNNTKESPDFKRMSDTLSKFGINGGVSQNQDGTYTLNKEAIRSQIANKVDQIYNSYTSKYPNAEKDKTNSNYGKEQFLLGITGSKPKATLFKGYIESYRDDKGKPLRQDQKDYLWNIFGTDAMTVHDWGNLNDGSKESIHSKMQVALKQYDAEDTNAKNIQITNELGNMITAISATTNKPAPTIAVELGLLDNPKIADRLPESIRVPAQQYLGQQVQQRIINRDAIKKEIREGKTPEGKRLQKELVFGSNTFNDKRPEVGSFSFTNSERNQIIEEYKKNILSNLGKNPSKSKVDEINKKFDSLKRYDKPLTKKEADGAKMLRELASTNDPKKRMEIRKKYNSQK